MSKIKNLLLLLAVITALPAMASTFDAVATKSLPAPPNAVNAIGATLANLKGLFQGFHPSVGSGVTIVQPLTVTGTATNPVVNIVVQECSFLCENVDFNAVISSLPASGSCQKNVVIDANLTNSSSVLSDVYDLLVVNVCVNPTLITVNVQARHAPNYQAGQTQQEILQFLQGQVAPISTAFNSALTSNATKMASAAN